MMYYTKHVAAILDIKYWFCGLKLDREHGWFWSEEKWQQNSEHK